VTVLTRFLIGTGGWAYFRVPGMKSLEAYSRAFDFVEVNSTFYEMPNPGTVKTWRRIVPTNFEFSVRCHRSVTHNNQLEPIEETYKTFNEMIRICQDLNSDFLVLQTPESLEFTNEKIESIRNFFASVNLMGIRIAWEIRQSQGRLPPAHLINLMKDNNFIHCVDLSKENPAYDSDIIYTRLFGKGEHNIYQFTDEELRTIDKRTTAKEHDTITMSFHCVKMYKDAARFKAYKQKGKFPSVTRSTGTKSLLEVLREDAKFPSTKQELIRHQGWKIIDLTPEERIHASEILQKLPDKTYKKISEVKETLENSNRPT
jgi:uncharacterized protein YecE (DUF72 family)